MNRNHSSGLTMTEALVTLAVAGVLLSIGLPSLTDFLEQSQLSSDANDLFASLMLTRSEAVTRNSVASMCKIDPASPETCDNSESWASGWISFVDDDGDGVRDAGELIVSTFTGMNSNTAVTPTNFTNSVSYLPSGSSTTNGRFNICVAGSIASDIFVNATGRPRVADSACP